jgi:hypothetical protein
MKTFRVSLSCVLVLLTLALTATAQSIQTDFDRSFNLASLKTFAFSPQNRKASDPLANSPLNDRRIHDALDSQLKANGLINTNEHPDFVISYFVTTRKGFDVQDNRYGILQRTGNLNVSEVTEGTLVVVFVESATGKEVWRGFVSGQITPKDLDKDVNKSVAKLVKKFIKNQEGKK